jgi:transcriptional regulator with XRE-family HTH domain
VIGLEYIVKLYKGTYKKLAEKLGITPSTVTDWLSKRRPIPKAKLEALSQIFKIEEELFQKELSKIEKIELRIDYLKRISKSESFEIEDIYIDEHGKEHEYKRTINPHEDEWRILSEELNIEKTVLTLQSEMYNELFNNIHNSGKTFNIVDRLSNVIGETVPSQLEVNQQIEWERKHEERLDAINSMMYWMGVRGSMIFNADEISFHNELYALLKKYNLLWEEE